MGKRLALSLFVLVALVLAAEGLASFVLAWRDAGADEAIAEQAYCEYDPLLGWVNPRNAFVEDLYGPGRSLTTNEQRFRARRNYPRDLPVRKTRIVCIGDSFTLGYGVDDANTFPAQLEALDPTIEAVNMGQGGYGVDQAVLWYLRDGIELEAHHVVLAFIAPDFDRITESRFQGQYAKPRLDLVDGELVLTEDPVPEGWSEVSVSSGLFDGLAITELLRRLRRRGAPPTGIVELEYLDVARALLVDLIEGAKSRGAEVTLVHIPLRDRSAGRPAHLLEALEGFGLDARLVDLTPAFDAVSPGERAAYYADDGHMNALGNRFIARHVLNALETAH